MGCRGGGIKQGGGNQVTVGRQMRSKGEEGDGKRSPIGDRIGLGRAKKKPVRANIERKKRIIGGRTFLLVRER